MNKSIYKIVEKCINTIPEIKYFGLYRNQFLNDINEREINYPAVLLEIKPFTFKQQLYYNQDTIVSISLHIGMNIVNNIESRDKMLDNSLTMLNIMDKIHEYIDGITSYDTFYSGMTESYVKIGNFTRTSQDQITNVKGLWYGKVTYSFPLVVAHSTGLLTTFSPTGMTITTQSYSGMTN